MSLPYQTVLRLPASEDAVAILEQEAEQWLLSKAPAAQREDVRSGAYFSPGIHRLADDKTVTVVHADRVEDGSRRRRLQLVERNQHGDWVAAITAVDYPAGNRRRDALIITASKSGDPHGDWVASPPRLVRSLLERSNIHDGAALVTAKPRIVTLDDIDEVLAAIEDRTRSVSVILAASLGAEYDAELRARVAQLTSELVGVAAVYFATGDALDELNARLGPAHGVEAGRIRTFLPLVDLSDAADARRHRVLGPATFAKAIRGSGVANYLQMAFAYETRSALLARTLPSDVRRGIDALDAEQRRLEQAQRIDNRVRDKLSLTGDDIPARPAGVGDKKSAPKEPPSDTRSAPPVMDRVLAKLAGISHRWLGKEMPLTEDVVDALDRHLTQQVATTEEWVDTAAGLEQERDDARALAEATREERDELDLELAIVEQDAEALRRKISYLQSQLIDAERFAEAFTEPAVDPEWDTPQSLVELATLLQEDSGQRHVAFRRVEFTGEIRHVEAVQKRDPVGRYVAAFWEFVRTLHDYADLKASGGFDGSVHQYLTSPIAGYKCSMQRHAATESESVIMNAAWRAQRELPVPESVSPDGRALMLAHFKPTHADTVAPRLHYLDDTDGSGKIYIGYIGRHLTNTKTKNA